MFKIGDVVTWKSQANGTWKSKTGKIVEIVPPHVVPTSMRSSRIGGTRHDESYVVQTEDSLNWPLVSKLEKVVADEPKVAAPAGCRPVSRKKSDDTTTKNAVKDGPKEEKIMPETKKTLHPKTQMALDAYRENRPKMHTVSFTVAEPVYAKLVARGKKVGFTPNQIARMDVVEKAGA